MTEDAVESWIRHIKAANLSSSERAIYALLSDLSCPLWKFDVLWEAWPELNVQQARYAALAQHLLSRSSQELFLTGSVIFDDVTIFCDLVGDLKRPELPLRNAYKSAYLSLRPVLFRTTSTEAPQVSRELTQEPQASPHFT
jgi:hypothetical protein